MTKRIIIGTLVSFLLLLIVLVVGADTYLCTARGSRQLQSIINRLIPGEIHWRQCSLSLFTGHVRLTGASVLSPTGAHLIDAERIEATVNLPVLLTGTLILSDAAVDNPTVRLDFDRRGDLELVSAFVETEPPDPTETESDFNLIIDNLDLKNGTLLLSIAAETDDTPGFRLAVHDIMITGQSGDLEEERADLVLNTGPAVIENGGSRWTVDRVMFAAVLNRDRLDGIRATVAKNGATVAADGRMANLWVKPVFDLTLRADSPLERVAEIMENPPDLSGRLSITATLKGTLDNPDTGVNLTVANSTVDDFRVDQLGLTARLNDRRLNLDSLDIRSPLGRISIRGDMNFQNAFPHGFLSSQPVWEGVDYRAAISCDQATIESVLPPGRNISGAITAQLGIEGNGVTPETFAARASVSISGRQLKLPELTAPLQATLAARLSMDPHQLTVDEVKLTSGDQQLSGNGRYDFSSRAVRATATLTASDPAQLFSHTEIRRLEGALQATITVEGTIDQPVARGEIAGKDWRYRDFTLGDPIATGVFEKGNLLLKRFELRNHQSTLSASGRVRLLDPQNQQPLAAPLLALDISGEHLSLENFSSDLKGNMAISGRIEGPTTRLSGKVTVDGKDIDLYGVQTIDSLSARGRLANERFQLDRFHVQMARGVSDVSGWISYAGDYAFRATADSIRLKQIARLEPYTTGEETLRFEITGKGRMTAPEMNGRVILKGLQANGHTIEDAEFQIGMQDGWLAVFGRQYLHFDARVHTQNKDFTVDAVFEDTELAPLFLLTEAEALSGKLRGNARLTGKIDDFESIAGTVEIAALNIDFEGAPLVRWSNAFGTLTHGTFSLPETRIHLLEKGHLDVSATGGLDGAVNVRSTGRIPLAVAGPFVEDITEIGGELRVAAEITGTLERPSIRGDVVLAEAAFSFPEFYQQIKDMNGKIVLSNDEMIIESFEAKSGNGTVSLTGSVGLKNFVPQTYALKAQTAKFPVNVPNRMELVIDSGLNLSGTPEAPRLTGQVTLLEGLYYEKIELNLLEMVVTQTAPVPHKPTDEKPSPYLANLAFDIGFSYRQPFVVDNNIALLTIKPNWRLYGTFEKPLLSGRAEIDSGTVTFQRQEFEITRGVFDFVNPYKIEPTIDIKSTTRVKEWTIYLDISGTPENLQYSLRSDPAESDADILSLLAFGNTTRGLRDSSSGGSSPSQLLADMVAAELQDRLKESTGLDSVELEYERGENASEQDRIRVSVGKELSRRLALKYGVERDKGQTVQSVETEYKFLEDLLMIVSQDTKGDFGSEIRYRIRFR